jgi:hypothetical protein
MSAPRIVGVRHHSPACARLVRRTIRSLRPAVVLVEGPADMNGRIGELALDHRLPIAIFSYYQLAQRAFASWTPLCDYSPEHVALREGLDAGAAVRFIDLPAWSVPFRGVENRYADRGRARADYVQRLCARLGVDGLDALWDHLFEQPMDEAVLEERLATYFESLRGAEGGEAVLDGDAEREAFMARHVAHAVATADGPVLVVCGGYHAPFLARAWKDAPTDPPEVPAPEAGARHGSYLVPYSFHRLDSFTGYEAGMPSPAYYQALWEAGPTRAGERMLEAAVRRLRDGKRRVSAADLVAAETMTRGLMRLRGHAAVARTDLLDGVAAALVKEGLEVPLPWSERGPIRPGTDPVLVEVLEALKGRREGALAPETPRPPLVADVRAELERLDLAPAERARTVTVDLTDARDRARSRALHRLRVLEVPGFTRTDGPREPTDPELVETWTIARVLDADAKLVEAAAWGPTLAQAAGARLEELLRAARGDLELLARLLGEALFVGLSALAERVLSDVAAQVHLEPHLDRLGGALAFLLALHRHDTLLGAAGSDELGRIIEAMVQRGLWLFEGMRGPDAPAKADELRALVAIRDAAKHARALAIDREVLRGVMERRAADPEAPPAHRGAALGSLWSLGMLGAEAEARQRAVRALRGAAEPTRVGELLAGLFALAREEVVAARELVEALDAILAGQTWEEFLIAVPALRLAFSWFPPRERDAIARLVLAVHGRAGGPARLRRLDVDAAVVTRGVELERRVSALSARFGLVPEEDPMIPDDARAGARPAPARTGEEPPR